MTGLSNKRIIFLKKEEKFLKELLKNSSRIKIITKDEENIKKLELISSLFFICNEYIYLILKSAKQKKSLSIPILSRTVFENSVTIALLFCLPFDDGIKRYKDFNKIEDFKLVKKYRTENSNLDKHVLKESELKEAEDAYNYFKEHNYPTNSWFGRNLYDSCLFLDKHHSDFLFSENFFEMNYLQTYPFLSKFVHGMPLCFEAISVSRAKWVSKNNVFFSHNMNHNVSFYYHTINAYLTILCAVGKLTGNEDFFHINHSLLFNHFGFFSNSKQKRDEESERLGIEPLRI